MNVSELYKVTKWISQEIESTQIPQLYSSLQQVLLQNSQQASKQPIESQKDSLIRALSIVNLSILTKDQLSFLSGLGIADAIGEVGINNIEDILYKNVIDIPTAAQKIQEIFAKVSEGLAKSNQIKTGLSNLGIAEEYELENEVLMRVTFTGQAKMGNVKDFKTWGNIWFDIGRGLAMAHDATPEDIKIVGATKGSIVIELAILAVIAKTASEIILEALKVAEKVLDIRKKAEEIRGMKLGNDKIANQLDEAAEDEKTKGITQITNNISLQLKIEGKGEGDKVKALDLAIKNLVNFISQGGEVDFVLPETVTNEDDESQINKDLRVAFQEIRKLENKIALLENKETK